MADLITSGIAALDERLGGLLPHRHYVVTGAPGTGKTVACLEFLHAALDNGEAAVFVAHDDPTDLLAQGEFLGIDLERWLAEERLVLLRYQLDFVRRFARAGNPDAAFDELRRLMGAVRPGRVVVDSVAPILEAGAASGAGILSLLRFLDETGATSLITYPADLAGLYDRRIEPLSRRVAGIFHFSRDESHGHRIDVRKIRYSVPSTAPISFRIKAGVGIVGIGEQPRRRAGDVSTDESRRLLVIDPEQTFPPDLLAGLRSSYDVAVHHSLHSAFAVLSAGSAAVLLEVRRDSVNDALTLVRELRRAGSRAPIVLVTQFTLRADDRARALRAGSDEFLSGDMYPAEFLIRVRSAIERGHVVVDHPEPELPMIAQPHSADTGYELLEPDAFRTALQAHTTGEHAPFFTLVILRPVGAGTAAGLGEAVFRVMRLDGGDLAGRVDGGVAIYLHSARRKDVRPFVERVREEWRRANGGECEAEIAAYPSEEHLVAALLTPRGLSAHPAPAVADGTSAVGGRASRNGRGPDPATPTDLLAGHATPRTRNATAVGE